MGLSGLHYVPFLSPTVKNFLDYPRSLYSLRQERRFSNLGGIPSTSQPSRETTALLLPDFICINDLAACVYPQFAFSPLPLMIAISETSLHAINFQIHEVVCPGGGGDMCLTLKFVNREYSNSISGFPSSC